MNYKKNLLSFDNVKTIKGEKKGYKTFILYLSPFTLNSKGVNLCPMASNGCASACLFESGFGGLFEGVRNGRTEKTEFYLSDRIGFLDKLVVELTKLQNKFKDSELTLAIRLNGTSDISFEKQVTSNGKTIFDTFPSIQFYDYTKNYTRFKKALPSNYHLTFSRSEINENIAMDLLSKGVNVSMEFDKLPETYKGYKVVNGDEDDLTFLHPKGVIIGLKYKKNRSKGGKEKNIEALKSGFVVITQSSVIKKLSKVA